MGGARKAYIVEEATVNDSRWSDLARATAYGAGYLFGSNCADVNKNISFGIGTDYAYVVNGSPLSGLIDLYNKVKEVFLDDIRNASECIYALHLQRQEARTRLNLTARSTLANPAASEAEKDAARNAIGTLRDTENNYAAGTSGFNSGLIFREQCFLMANIISLSEYSKNQSTYVRSFSTDGMAGSVTGPMFKKAPYGGPHFDSNASICLDAETPYAFMNALSIGAAGSAFFDMKNHDISTLQPMIKLYKIIFDEERKKEVSQELKFDSFANTAESYTSLSHTAETLLSDKNKRGFGIGIKSFNFKYAGSNPFAVKRSISAQLKIFANSFDELLRERTVDDGRASSRTRSGETRTYRYVDLALKTSNQNRAGGGCDRSTIGFENEELAKLNFRLKAVVGWAYPEGKTSHLTNGVKDALYDSYVTLNLTPTVHDFEFDDQGRVTFTINYLAYTDDFFDQEDYNIFIDPAIAKTQLERRMQFEQLSNSCASSDALEN
ncbi:MAG TPA: hypothetical protein DCM40_10195, partial [Maribacter sp.]|nr:hypothetical protein [Maribacter sp.]